ncbi:MAG: 50S ribosomal protein L6 [Anaerolinea sp.]|nr:50S ribosomal protein L6 [Anaerolinea sp.]
MSRIGKKPISIPAKVTIDIQGQDLTVKGPKGELKFSVHPDITVTQEDGSLVVTRPTDEREHRALHGLTRALVANMVEGVSNGYTKSLTVTGVGYNGEVKNSKLIMKLGYSHEIVVDPPQHITFEVERQNPTEFHIRVRGVDKQLVGQVAANIRELRPPEPYLGKGVRYSNEVLRRKVGKTGK